MSQGRCNLQCTQLVSCVEKDNNNASSILLNFNNSNLNFKGVEFCTVGVLKYGDSNENNSKYSGL